MFLIIFLMAGLAPCSISWSLFLYSGSHFLFFFLCTFSNFFFHYIIPLQLPCTLSLTLTADIYSGRCCHVAVVIASRPCGSKWWKFLARNWQAANLLYARNTHPHAELHEWMNACTSTSIIRSGKVVTGWCFQSDDLIWWSAFEIFNVTARKVTLCQKFLFWGPSLLPFILPLSVDTQYIPALYFCHHPSLFLCSRAICDSPLVLTSFFPSPLAPSPCNRSGIVFWLSRALWFQRDREQTSLKSAWRKCAQPSAIIINIFLTFIQSQQNCQKDTKTTKFYVKTLCCVLFS